MCVCVCVCVCVCEGAGVSGGYDESQQCECIVFGNTTVFYSNTNCTVTRDDNNVRILSTQGAKAFTNY